MKKCNGVKPNGNVCPMKGSCALFNPVSESGGSIIMIQAPYTMVNGNFSCNDYKLTNEQNLNGGNYGDSDLIGS